MKMLVKKIFILSNLFGNLFFIANAFSSDLSFQLDSQLDSADQLSLKQALAEVNTLLPDSFKDKLPRNIVMTIDSSADDEDIPTNICDIVSESHDQKESHFEYGSYTVSDNTLELNHALIDELKKGKNNSTKIDCQHKTIYNQGLATIIHELSHAFDFQNGRPSNNPDFYRRAGFKKGFLKIKDKNVNATRSADPYERVSVSEAFAVNFEYFIMDTEFACRKPSLFDFYKKLLNFEPYPNRTCQINSEVFMTSENGLTPVSLDLERVYRIDYLLASAGTDMVSGFGHAMFRIIMCAPEHLDEKTQKIIPATPMGPKCLEDKFYHLVVSYRANAEGANLNYIKGMLGGYPSMLFIIPFGDVLDEYNRDELRDLISYPLRLNRDEIKDFLINVIENYWEYRGDYKFFTNNCAVESLDLLKTSLHSQLKSIGPVTPQGVLEDLDHLQLLSKQSANNEFFSSKKDLLLESFKLTGQDSDVDFDDLQDYIKDSHTDSRMKAFLTFTEKGKVVGLNAESLLQTKEKLKESASFLIIEQQIFHSRNAIAFKKFVELIDSSNSDIKKQMAKLYLDNNLSSTINNSKTYGIPLMSELDTPLQDNNGQALAIKDLFNQMLAEEAASLEEINKNIEQMNKYIFNLRMQYRKNFEQYVQSELIKINSTLEGMTLIAGIKAGQADAFTRVRQKLNPDLLSLTAISDERIQSYAASF